MQREFPHRMANARRALSEYLHTDPDRLAFVSNATTGMNVVATSIAPLLKPGEEVLGTSLEYGAMDRMWESICRESGAIYRMAEIPLPTRGNAVLEILRENIGPATRALTFSHITSTTALQLPAEALIALAREHRIFSIVDGAHAPGQIPLKLDDLGADFYVGNCHKWMMAPKSVGFLHASKSARDLVRPVVISWGMHSLADGFVREFDYQGTRNIAPTLSVEDAIRFMEEHGWERERHRCNDLAMELEARLCDHFGAPSLYALDPSLRPPQMSAVRLPDGADGDVLKSSLWEDHRIEVPVTKHPSTGHFYLRVSLQGYNTREDCEALLEALANTG